MRRRTGRRLAALQVHHSLLERTRELEIDLSKTKVENQRLRNFKQSWIRYLTARTTDRRTVILREIANELKEEIKQDHNQGG